MNIPYGADEMILWLRKNRGATASQNDILGREIRRIVESLGGKLDKEDAPAYWANSETDKNIGEFNLPKTAAQYQIPISQMVELFTRLNDLNM